MGLTIKRDTSLDQLFDKFATLPDDKKNIKNNNKDSKKQH